MYRSCIICVDASRTAAQTPALFNICNGSTYNKLLEIREILSPTPTPMHQKIRYLESQKRRASFPLKVNQATADH
jgi:hypothetical protein